MFRLRPALAVLACLLLAACGFQLRGAYPLPFQRLYIAMPEANELHAQIKRSVEAGSGAQVVSSEKEADAVLRVQANSQEKRVLSTSASGKVREHELVRAFAFQLVDNANRALLPPSQIVVRRDFTYSDAVVLAKEAEEQILWRDMQNDLVQQLMRRLATAKPRAE